MSLRTITPLKTPVHIPYHYLYGQGECPQSVGYQFIQGQS